MRAELGSPFDMACRSLGLDPTGARLLRSHSASVHLLPRSGVVVRLSPDTGGWSAARRALAMTAWLNSVGFPAVVPAPELDQPIELDGRIATFWLLVDRPPRQPAPGPASLGRLLRRLHDLPAPPVDLPPYEPLAGFAEIVSRSRSITRDDQVWLLDEASVLLDDYRELDSELGVGHLHGDAYPGNLLGTVRNPVLGDWEEAATGPRELDLANTYHGVRFGRTTTDLDAFAAAYGHDLRDWSGLSSLTGIRDLHTLGSYIRRADAGDAAAAAELGRRVSTLRRRDRLARWTAG